MKINNIDYLNYLEIVTKKIEENRDYITELDSVTGDGDHWVNMNKGFQKLVEIREELEKLNLGDMFKKIGMTIMSTVGGSSGALYGSAYIRAAKAIGDKKEMDIELLSQVLEAKLNAIMERGNAKAGDKTMIDPLYLATEYLKKAIGEGKDEKEALDLLKEGSIKGMNDTKDMEAAKGRAYYQENKGRGHLDPGAVTMSYQLEILADYIKENC